MVVGVEHRRLTADTQVLHDKPLDAINPENARISRMYLAAGTALEYAFSFFFQAEDGIRDQPRSRGLGDVYKRQDYSGI